MTEERKLLGQAAPNATTPTDLYTVPTDTEIVGSSIVVCNTGGTATTFRISVRVAGAGDDQKQYLYRDTPIPANDTFVATIGITLSATDVVTVYAGNANLSFNLFGIEITSAGGGAGNSAAASIADSKAESAVTKSDSTDVSQSTLIGTADSKGASGSTRASSVSVSAATAAATADSKAESAALLAGGAGAGQGYVTILPWAYSGITQGTWAFAISGSEIMGGTFYNSTNAQNDQIDYLVYLAAGTYTLTIVGVTKNTRAIITLLIDGVSEGTMDQYSAGEVYNVVQSITGIVIAASGFKTISLKAATRHASSIGWYILVSSLSFYRTA